MLCLVCGNAPLAELVDALDSKSSSARSAGSTPAWGTTGFHPRGSRCVFDAERCDDGPAFRYRAGVDQWPFVFLGMGWKSLIAGSVLYLLFGGFVAMAQFAGAGGCPTWRTDGVMIPILAWPGTFM